MAGASKLEEKIRTVFAAYRAQDAESFVALLHPGFSFTSPYDDAIDRAAFMERCWPGVHSLTGHELKQISIADDAAFVLVEVGTTAGASYRNVERFVFRDDLLYRVEVFFGDPQADHGRWTSDDIHAAATVRKLIGDRYAAIRGKQTDAAMVPVADEVVMFDVIEPLRHTNAGDLRRREQDWFDGFDGPISLEVKDLVVCADGDTAFAHSLNRYAGALKGGGSTDMWVRHTSCYRFKEHGWRLVHEHLSVPFNPATGRWSLNARPSVGGSEPAPPKPETSLQQVYGQLSCMDLCASEAWFEKLFGRAPDAKPMAGLAQWQHHGVAGLQLLENAEHAGHGTVTLIVADLRTEHERLEQAGLAPGPIEAATTTSLVRLRDPDGNLIVLADEIEP